ncbi:MAG: type II secretion system F family protein [Moraxellaceae bacterium]
MAVILYALTMVLLLLVLFILLGWRGAAGEKQMIRERFSGGMSGNQVGSQMKKMALAAGNISALDSLRRRVVDDDEVGVMLSRAGIHNKQARSLYHALSILSPVVLAVLVILAHLIMSPGFKNPALVVIAAVIIGILMPKRLLGVVADRRREEIRLELPVFVQTLRILFDSGLAVEQALRVLTSEAKSVFPQVAAELWRALQRASSGLDLADELARISDQLQVEEFTDTVSILRQMIRQGGSARTSLLNLQKLIEDRQMAVMQERVTKLSAKMAIVMILFLFPALFILLAAPGFMALTRALGAIT